MADEKNPDIITVMPSAVKAVLIQLRQAISIRHIRGIHPFLGLGEEKPFTIPPREIVTRRCRFNALFFATNYTILVGTLSVLTILMNPLFLFAIVMVALGWAYVAKLANNDDEMNPILIAGRKVTSKERSLAMMGVSGLAVFFFGGSVIFTILSASGICITAHTLLRNHPIPEDDELGFLVPIEYNTIDETV